MPSVRQSDNGANCGVHAWSVASAGDNAYPLQNVFHLVVI